MEFMNPSSQHPFSTGLGKDKPPATLTSQSSEAAAAQDTLSNGTRDYGDLRVTLTSEYDTVWMDGGSGAKRNVKFFRPRSQGQLRPLGTVGMGSYNGISGQRATLLVGSAPGGDAVASPESYELVWKDQGSGARSNGSIWRPRAPSGYVALGDVVSNGWGSPSTSAIYCLKREHVMEAHYAGRSFWDDAGSKAKSNVTCFDVLPDPPGIRGSEHIPICADTFRASNAWSRDPPSTSIAYVPALFAPNEYNDLSTMPPPISSDPNEFPRTDDIIDHKVACTVTLPFITFLGPQDKPSLDRIQQPFCKMTKEVAWRVIGAVWNNKSASTTLGENMVYGITVEQSQTITESAGVSVSAEAGFKFVTFNVSANYQFTKSNTSSFSEYRERSENVGHDVPPYTGVVQYSRHQWIRVERTDGSRELVEIQLDGNSSDKTFRDVKISPD